MKPSEKLDSILARFRDYDFISFDLLELNKDKELFPILNKLEKEGWIETIEEKIYDDNLPVEYPEIETKYRITFDGMYFKEMGGYTQQGKDKQRDRLKTDVINIAIAIGTGLAGIYAIYELFKSLYNC